MKKIFLLVAVFMFLIVPFVVAKDKISYSDNNLEDNQIDSNELEVDSNELEVDSNELEVDSNATEDDLNEELEVDSNELEVDSNATIVSCGRLEDGELLRSRHFFDTGTSIVKLAEMQAVISVGLENGIDVSQLEAIMNEVKAKFDLIVDVNDAKLYKISIGEIKELISNFRETAHGISAFKLVSKQINEKLHKVKQQTNEEVKKTHEQAKLKASTAALAVFDLHICNAENKVRALKERDVNGTFIQEVNDKLGNVKDLRSELKVVLLSSSRKEIKFVDQKIKDAWKEFRQVFLNAQKNIVKKYRKKITMRLEKIKDKFKKFKEDTKDLENMSKNLVSNLKRMERSIDSVDLHYEKLSFKKSKKLIKEMQESFKSVKSKYVKKRKERAKSLKQNVKEIEDSVIETSNSLDEEELRETNLKPIRSR